ncbi:hypothetical protein EV182_004001, partial [Spiromyces aspiralis]
DFIATAAELCGVAVGAGSPSEEDLSSIGRKLRSCLEAYKDSEARCVEAIKAQDELRSRVSELSARLGESDERIGTLSRESKDYTNYINAVTAFLNEFPSGKMPEGVSDDLRSAMRAAKDRANGVVETERRKLAEAAANLAKMGELESRNRELADMLQQAHSEKGSLEKEYDMLLDKLGKMRDALSLKVSGESNELKAVRAENLELQDTVASLQTSLSSAREELEAANDEIKQLRLYSDQEIGRLTDLVRTLEDRLELLQTERDQLGDQIEVLRADFNETLNSSAKREEEFEMQAQTIQNLQSALEQLQQKQDLETNLTINKLEGELGSAWEAVREWEVKAKQAEEEVRSLRQAGEISQKSRKQLEMQAVEIGRLRHEVLILKDHLNESMRRLREESNDFNLDKRVITNLIVSFLSLPYGDSKRYEVLQLMSSILQFTEEQQQKVGLVRKAGKPIPARGQNHPSHGPSGQDTEIKEASSRTNLLIMTLSISFSDMWISFLLRESSLRNHSQRDQNGSGA